MAKKHSEKSYLWYAFVALALVALSFAVGFVVNGSIYGETAAADATAVAPDLEPDARKRAYELHKLQQEVESLRVSNDALSRTDKWLTAWLTAIGGIVAALLLPAVGLFLNRAQDRKLEQERKQSRERQLLKVFNDLGDDKPTVRVGAIAVLVQRMRTLSELKEKAGAEDREDLRAIVSVLISASKHESEENIQKYIADGLADGLNARLQKEGDAVAKVPEEPSPLQEYDFQGAQLQNAWWYGIDARGVDFYEANLSRAGLRDSVLSGAVLKNANLTRATLSGANLSTLKTAGKPADGETDGEASGGKKISDRQTDLQGARLFKAKMVGTNLTGALLGGANLVGANLTDAILERADLSGADLTGADLTGATFNRTKLAGAKISRKAFERATRTNVEEKGIVWADDAAAEQSAQTANPAQITKPAQPAQPAAASSGTHAAAAPKVITHRINFGEDQQAVKITIETGGASGVAETDGARRGVVETDAV